MLAQYDTFNEAPRSHKAVDEPRPQRKKWVSSSSLWDMAHGQLMGMLAPCVYLLLYTAYDVKTTKSAKTGDEYSSFSPACAVLCVEVGKGLLSLLAYIVLSSESWPSISKLGYYFAALALPAACYSGITVVNLSRLGHVSLMQYGIWNQFTIVLSILLWFMVFRRKCSVQQSIALMVLFAGCSVNAVQPGSMFAVETTGLWVLACSALSAIGCVSNEYFYKSDKAADMNLQNVVLYLMTSLCSVLFIMSTCSERLTSIPSFFFGIRSECCVLIVIQVFSGLAIAQMLKHTSVITKCYTQALGINFEVVLAYRLSGAHEISTSVPMAFASFLIAISTLLYYTANVPEPLSMHKSMGMDASRHALAKFRQTPFKWQMASGRASPAAQFKV